MKSADQFTQSYIEAALWSTSNPADPSDCPENLDKQHDTDDLPESLLLSMQADCDAFRETYADLLEKLDELHDVDDNQNGHDFWLTREGHGAGFWNRGYGPIGDELTEAAKTFGNGSDEFYQYACWNSPEAETV